LRSVARWARGSEVTGVWREREGRRDGAYGMMWEKGGVWGLGVI
jgi:hypothetical protein